MQLSVVNGYSYVDVGLQWEENFSCLSHDFVEILTLQSIVVLSSLLLPLSHHSNHHHLHMDPSHAPQFHVPPGYTIRQMPDGNNYIVPKFLIDATDLAIQSETMKKSLEVEQAPSGVSTH